jgi:hypothetical protein
VRLFQGADHLIQVASTGYSEVYKRFYYRDIQAITIQKTHMGKLWNGVWGFFIATFGLPAFNMPANVAIGMWCVAGFFAVFLIGNLLTGPTCACYIRTAVQVERLVALTRIRSARRLLRRVRPVIDAAQGSVSREEMLLQFREPAPGTTYKGDLPPIISQAENETAPVGSPENSPGPFG